MPQAAGCELVIKSTIYRNSIMQPCMIRKCNSTPYIANDYNMLKAR